MLAVGNNEITNVMVGSTEISNAYIGNTLVWTRDFPKPWLCFEASVTQGTSVSMTKVGSPSYTPRLEYSTNGKNWSTFTPGSTSVKIAKQGDKVWFRAPSGQSNTRMGTDQNNYWKFNPNGYVSISGDVTSVLQTDGNVLTLQNYALTSLFRQNYYIRDVSGIVIPATKVGNRSCSSMFRDCQSLSTAPSELYIGERTSTSS